MQASRHCVALRLWLLLPLAAAVAATGCQAFPKMESMTPGWFKRDKKSKVVDSKFKRPVRMVVLWTPSILNEPGMPPARGFGGRIYFYDEKSETIPVEGQIVVYGYDENTPREGNARADRKFVFPAEKITEHYSPTDLGASYSVWIPWGQPTDPSTEVTLVSVLTTSSGTVVVDEGAKNNLPGVMSDRQKKISKSANPDSLFSATDKQGAAEVAQTDGRPKQLQATTIPLAPKHLEQASKTGAEQYVAQEPRATNRVVPAAVQEQVPPQNPASATNRAGSIESTGVENTDAEYSNEKYPRAEGLLPKRERRSRRGGVKGTLLSPSSFD